MHVKGTVLTGWQRYDHFGTLCELLPAGLPSLAVCLSAMQRAGVTKTELNNVNDVLGCRPDSPIQWFVDTKDKPAPSCSYPGHRILEGRLCCPAFGILCELYCILFCVLCNIRVLFDSKIFYRSNNIIS